MECRALLIKCRALLISYKVFVMKYIYMLMELQHTDGDKLVCVAVRGRGLYPVYKNELNTFSK